MHCNLIKILFISAIAALAFPAIAMAGDAAAGKSLFEVNCGTCHGMTGKGDGPISAALTPRPRDFSKGEFKLDANKSGSAGEDEDLRLVIKQGALMYGGSPLMTGWPTLSDEQIGQLIAYICSLKE